MKDFIENDNALKRFWRPIKRKAFVTLSWRDKIWPYLIQKNCESAMPDVIIAGLPKTSTTWIAKTLSGHESVVLKAGYRIGRGEVNYFSDSCFSDPLKKYLAFNSKKSADKIYIEKSPVYCSMHISRLKLIKRLNPNVKIILSFRYPVDWLVSFAKMEMVTGRRQLTPIDENWQEFKEYYNWKRCQFDFENIYSNWQSVFGENLLMVNFKDVMNDPGAVLSKILDFVAVSSDDFVENARLSSPNKTKIDSWPENHSRYIERLFAKDIAWYESNCPELS